MLLLHIQRRASSLPSDIRWAMREASKCRMATDTDSYAFFRTNHYRRREEDRGTANIMRRIISFLLIFAALAANARHVTPEEAQSIATEFFNSGSPSKVKKAPRRTVQSPRSAENQSESQPYYIFNASDNAGFVIISGDTRAKKILGYSDSGNFDAENMPPQLTWLLGEYEKQMESLPVSESQNESWQRDENPSSEGILLETANWGQGYPYNAQCPIIDGVRTPTGSAATAMAIIMKYHNWPQKYDWEQMTENSISSGNTSFIAELMSDIGKSIHTTYGANESTALKSWPMHKLRQVFHYSPNCQRIFRKNYTDEEWRNIIAQNIDNKYPILYSADDLAQSIAHAFIIDGYKTDMYHVNWGWNGNYNGYYNLDALSANYSDYNDNHEMIINIIPDTSGIEYSECFTDGSFYGYSDFDGIRIKMNISVQNVTRNIPFDIKNSITFCPEGFEGSIALALVSSNNEIKEILQSSEHECSTWYPYEGLYRMSAFFYEAWNVTVSTDISDDDRIQLVAKRNNENEYKLMLGTEDWPSWIPVNNNTPILASITFDIDKEVEAKIWSDHTVEEVLPEGISELQVLWGDNVNCTFNSNNPLIDGSIILQVDGFDISPCSDYISDKTIDGINVGGFKSVKVSARLVELTEKSIHLSCPGELIDKIDVNEALGIRKLSISGRMDARDFYYIRGNMPSLCALDISEVSIDAVDVIDDIWNKGKPKRIKCPENALPFRAFTSLTHLESIKLPSTITEIMEGVFIANDLKHITIPTKVSKIGLGAFYENHNLKTVEIQSYQPIALNHNPFMDTPYNEGTILYVPNGYRETYANANIWGDFKEIKEGSVSLVEDIAFPNSEIELILNQKAKINVTVLPENAHNKELEWSTSSNAIAYVDETGLVYPYKQGECLLIARATDGSGVQATCKIRINEASGIDEIQIDTDENVKIFNLLGVLMYSGKYCDAILDKGLYIMQVGDKTIKHLIK